MSYSPNRAAPDLPAEPERIPRNVKALGFVSLLTDAATEMIYPLIPLYVSLLGAGAVVLGVIEGVAETTAALLKLFSGIVSDRIGHRKLLIVAGYGLSSFIRPLTGIVLNAWQIVGVRMLDRVGKGIRTAPRDALIAASVNERIRGRSFGFERAMDHAGAVLGPVFAVVATTWLILGAGFAHVADILRWTFILALIPGLAATATAIAFVTDVTLPAKSGRTSWFGLSGFDRRFTRYLLVILLFTLGNSSDIFLLFRVGEVIRKSGMLESLISAIPFTGEAVSRLGESGIREQMPGVIILPLIWGMFHVIKSVFSTPLGSLSDRIGRKTVIMAGWLIYASVYAGFAIVEMLPASLEGWATVTLFAVYGMYYAFTEGAEKALVADLVGADRRGAAFGLYNFIIGVGALPASIFFGLLYQSYGGLVAFGSSAAIAVLSFAMLGWLVREERTPNGTASV